MVTVFSASISVSCGKNEILFLLFYHRGKKENRPAGGRPVFRVQRIQQKRVLKIDAAWAARVVDCPLGNAYKVSVTGLICFPQFSLNSMRFNL